MKFYQLSQRENNEPRFSIILKCSLFIISVHCATQYIYHFKLLSQRRHFSLSTLFSTRKTVCTLMNVTCVKQRRLLLCDDTFQVYLCFKTHHFYFTICTADNEDTPSWLNPRFRFGYCAVNVAYSTSRHTVIVIVFADPKMQNLCRKKDFHKTLNEHTIYENVIDAPDICWVRTHYF